MEGLACWTMPADVSTPMLTGMISVDDIECIPWICCCNTPGVVHCSAAEEGRYETARLSRRVPNQIIDLLRSS